MKDYDEVEFEKVYETIPGNGWLSKAEAKLLYKACYRVGGAMLEVGCYQGRSTVLMASFKQPLYCVDPFDDFAKGKSGDEIQKMWERNVWIERGLSNANLFRERIEDWDPPLATVDLAYLDGDHSYQGTIDQIEKALTLNPLYILVHDVNDSGDGLEIKRAAVELLGAWTTRVERLAIWKQ